MQRHRTPVLRTRPGAWRAPGSAASGHRGGRPPRRGWRQVPLGAGALVVALLAAAGGPAWGAEAAGAEREAGAATPVLRCLLRYAGETRRVEARPVVDPYTVAPHEIGGRFGLKAVVVGAAGRVEHVALYSYDLALPQSPVLIHEVVHRPPFPASPEPPALTGWNHVYSSRLGREFVYGCALDAGVEAAR